MSTTTTTNNTTTPMKNTPPPQREREDGKHNILVEVEIDRMNRMAIGRLISPGLKDIHDEVYDQFGPIYLRFFETDGDQKGANGIVRIASIDQDAIDLALKLLAELVKNCERVQGRTPRAPPQRYRLAPTQSGSYEVAPAPAPQRPTLWDQIKVTPVQTGPAPNQRQRRSEIARAKKDTAREARDTQTHLDE